MDKKVSIGSGAVREIEDIELSRYACYLIVQNGDPTKPVIAHGQGSFCPQITQITQIWGGNGRFDFVAITAL